MTERGYWRRSVWEHGRVRTVHYGAGPAGLAVALLDEERREARDRWRLARRAVDAEQAPRLERERARGRAVRQVVAATLGQLGYVRYDRGRWKRRVSMLRVPASPARRDVPAGAPAPPGPKALKALMERVRARAPGAYGELEELARVHPKIVADEFGSDLSWLAQAALTNKIGGSDPVYDVAIMTRMDLLIAELAGECPSVAVRLVAQATAFAWCEHWSISALVAAHPERVTPMQLRRQAGAHRRFMSSLKTYVQISALENYVGARAAAARLAAAAALPGPPDE